MRNHPETQHKIAEQYRLNIEKSSTEIQKLRKSKRLLAVLRLISFLGGLTCSWYFWPNPFSVFISIILFSVFLTYLVFRDTDKTAELQNHERLIRINQHELDVMQYHLHEYDNGHSFSDPLHPYANDLDLFGDSSLFQWLNRCHAEQSKKLLSDHLKKSLAVSTIIAKQESAKELSEMQETCQQFQSLAMANPLSFQTEERLKNWMSLPPVGYEKVYWKWFQNIFTMVSLAVLLFFCLDYMSTRTFVYWVLGFYTISLLISRRIIPVYDLLSRIQPEMNTLYKQLDLIEKGKLRSSFLQSLQKRLRPAGSPSASQSISEFNRILKRFDIRLNMLVGFFCNLFLLWDLRQLISLNEWKKKNRLLFNDWFTVIAEMEVTISLASLVYNEPEWSFPEVDENYFHFSGKDIGHPLIHAANRITNDFAMEGIGKIALITGSNMAGKSTFLRSLGVNTILALMGAPVCARQMKLSLMKVMSSMRVADNLAENTSTFYAELKKLKLIIESVERKENSFILLDEVLRGTNSADRHKGSQALVRQLLKSQAVAVMATHDTDLANSESANASVSNYHFDGRIREDELYFDYKIKNGICESLNATALMKKIGIHFQD